MGTRQVPARCADRLNSSLGLRPRVVYIVRYRQLCRRSPRPRSNNPPGCPAIMIRLPHAYASSFHSAASISRGWFFESKSVEVGILRSLIDHALPSGDVFLGFDRGALCRARRAGFCPSALGRDRGHACPLRPGAFALSSVPTFWFVFRPSTATIVTVHSPHARPGCWE